MDDEVEEFLAHYGVLGMKWGVRNDNTPRRTDRAAAKDAKESALAKMYYGEGAGTRRKLINNAVKSKSKDPVYKKAFDRHLANQDLAKAGSKARSKRSRTDRSNSAKKTARGIGHVLRGNSQYASLAAVVVAGGGAYAYKNGGDKFIKKHGATAVKTIKNEVNIMKARRMMKNMGL